MYVYVGRLGEEGNLRYIYSKKETLFKFLFFSYFLYLFFSLLSFSTTVFSLFNLFPFLKQYL